MSYIAFITRDQTYPFLRSSSTSPIALDEWTALVGADSTLTLDANDELVAIWTGSPLPFRFCPERADIVHSDPVPEVLEKMVELSAKISAVVRGGDGEFWLSGSEMVFPDHPDFPSID